jgi:hypothetical protein
MALLLEYVGCVHIYLGPYRGNPIALYLKRTESGCHIGPKVYPWHDVIGTGETPNKAAADFEEKWKARGLTPEMYSGPSWEGGIKPERPAPPKPAVPPKPAAPSAATVASPGPSPKPVATAPSAQVPTPATAPASQPDASSPPSPEQPVTASPTNGQQTPVPAPPAPQPSGQPS